MKYKTLLFAFILISASLQTASANITSIFTSSNPAELTALLQSHSIFYYGSVFFIIGLFLAFTPCVLPMVPILSGVIAKQDGGGNKKSNIRLATFYVLGMASSYAVAGMLAGYFGSSLQSLLQTPLVIAIFSGLMILMGLAMLDVFQLAMPAWLLRFIPQPNSTKKGGLGIFLTGAISTLVVSPCVTAPLIGVLTFIGQTGQVILGGTILFIMALGMGIPLILFAAGQGALLPKAGKWMLLVKLVFSYLMFAIALWLASRVLSETVAYSLYAILILAFAMHISIYLQEISNTYIKSIAYLFIIICSYLGLQPLLLANEQNKVLVANNHVIFNKYSQLAPLAEALKQAAKDNKPVFLEFYASWCGDCIAMDNKVFTSPDVIKALDPFVRIKVDLSESTPLTTAFKKKYHVYGTPMLLFYNAKGKPLDKFNAAGFIKSKDFVELIAKVSVNVYH